MPMTRRRKLLLLLVAVPLALVLLLVVAVFTPAVQTYVARSALSSQGTVQRVAVGSGGAAITGLSLEQPGVKISIPDFRVDLPVFSAVGGNIDLRALVARGVVIDYDPVEAARHAAENPSPIKPSPPAGPFDGILRLVTLPKLQVNGIDLEGELRVSGPQPVTAKFALTGGGIAAGKAGLVELKITAQADRTSDVITTLVLVPTLDGAGQLSALALTLDATAKGFLLAAPATLRSEVNVTREGTGEAWSLRVIAREKALVELDTSWSPGATDFPGRWKFDLTDADLTPFVPFFALPSLALTGDGTLAVLGTERLQAAGKLDFAVDGLEVLGLPELGPITLNSRFDLDASAAEAKVNAFTLTLAAGTSPVLETGAKQAFSYAIPTGKIASARPADELLSIRLLDVPSAWVGLFVPELTLTGPVTGAWSVRPEGDGVALDSTAPFVVSGVSYGAPGEPLLALDAVRVEGLRVRQNSLGLEAAINKLGLVVDGAEMLTMKLTAGRETGQPLLAHIEVGAALASLVRQPALSGMTTLSAGRAFVVLDATAAESGAIDATGDIRITGLRANGPADLPDLHLQPVVKRSAEGVASLRLPLTVSTRDPVRVSDLNIDATITPARLPDGDLTVLVKLLSQVLHVPDLQLLGALVAEAAPATPPVEDVPAGDVPATPLWDGVTGEVSFALGRLVLMPGIEMLNTDGRLALTKEAISLEKFAAMLGTGGELGLGGVLRWFEATSSYAVEADVRGKDIPAGPLLRALNPSASVPLEGTYTLAGKLTGAGEDPAAAITGALASCASPDDPE